MLRTYPARAALLVLLVLASSTRSVVAQNATAATLDWQPTHTDAIRVAGQTNRFVLVHFYSPNCQACQTIERDVYSQPAVRQQIYAKFVPFRVNVDEQPLTATKYGINSTPMDLILDGSGRIAGPASRINCPTTAEAYLAALDSAVAAPKVAAPAPVAATQPTMVAPNPQQVNPMAPQPPAANVARYQPPPTAPPSTPLAYNHQTPPTTTTPPAPTTEPMRTEPPKTEPQKPAIAAYSNDRYAEFFKRWNSPQSATGGETTPAAQPPVTPNNSSLVQAPTATQPQASSSTTWGAAGGIGQPNNYGANPPAQNASQSMIAALQPQATMVQPAASGTLGFEGYCPVTMIDQNRWQAGDRRWGAVHRGRTYLFAGPEEQQRFMANPDHYSPAISGRDVVAALDQGQTLEGQRQFGIRYGGRMYLFANATNRDTFKNNADRYSGPVLQAETPNRGTTWR